MSIHVVRVLLTLALAGLSAAAASAAERPYATTEERAPCAGFDPLKQPFFGDTHVHTAYSFDANAQNTRNKPDDAYRFAKGERMGIQPYDDDDEPQRFIQLDRPLDFVALSDHAALLGEIDICTTKGTWTYWHPVCLAHRSSRDLSVLLFGGRALGFRQRWGFCGEDGQMCLDHASSIWQEIVRAAEDAYDRSAECSFTSFVGYEWTASVDTGKNLHRNVIFRNANVPKLPTSWIETPSAWDLWDHLDRDCRDADTGCDVLTIPHNSNISAGLMFESAKIEGSAEPFPEVDAAEARRRARMEPIIEIMQHKGSSECDVVAGFTNDETCDFETLPYDSFGGGRPNLLMGSPQLPDANNFVRWALSEGLRQQMGLGANGLKYGIIASTDTHIAAPGLTTEDAKHPGHGGFGKGEGAVTPEDFADNIEFGPGGLAVVWAEENSRDAIFEAMLRRETYGTSGTRPIVRFFGGWEYSEDLCERADLVAQGYAGGVAMGGDLPARLASTSAPRFVVSAARDPGSSTVIGSPLQRVQIVKGWLEGDEHREQIYEVAGGDNGATVDLSTCEPKGPGAEDLCGVWTDPDFDASSPAWYYARVFENPSCRWSQYTCNAAGVDCSDPASVPEGLAACCDESHKAIIQERAWTSPIWYTP
ncbi:MAG: DUF3604 domain-containing protein [bacterium]|nr:DUF3604 domain-containing protein [bacterium]